MACQWTVECCSYDGDSGEDGICVPLRRSSDQLVSFLRHRFLDITGRWHLRSCYLDIRRSRALPLRFDRASVLTMPQQGEPSEVPRVGTELLTDGEAL